MTTVHSGAQRRFLDRPVSLVLRHQLPHLRVRGDPLTPEDVYRCATPVQLPAWQGWAKAAKEKIDAMLRGDDVQKAA